MTGQAGLERRERPDRERLAAALHVTNGDITVDLLRRAGLTRHALSWADVLHEGPVPGGLSDDELRRVRAQFIAAADGVNAGELRRRFQERDRILAAGRAGEYLLWFEADLYDQLQIAQILAALAASGWRQGGSRWSASASTRASPTSAGWASSSPSSSRACSTSPCR